MKTYKYIEYLVNNSIVTIMFNRPEVSNAFDVKSYDEITDAVMEAAADENIRVIILTGNGKHFSAGGDIRRFKGLIESKEYLLEENVLKAGKMASSVRRCSKPVIAMINGVASGAGCSLALACDFRIMSSKSKLVMSFIKMGLSGDTGGLYYLQKLVGVSKATELMMMGNPLDGNKALELGIANLLTDEDNLEKEAYDFATALANGPSYAISKQKELITEFFFSDLDDYTMKEAKYMVECSYTNDFEEAVNAFLEKRTPFFKGK